MTSFSNVLDVFRLLEKTNCKKCDEKTCLVFATKVFQGDRALDECPLLPDAVLAKYHHEPRKRISRLEQDQQARISDLKRELLKMDFSALAKKVGGRFSNGKLTIRILGKPFSIDGSGVFSSDIHVNPWVVLAVLGYLSSCKGVPLSGRWVPFRELENGRERSALFVHRAEKPLKKIADANPDLFKDLIIIFDGKKVERFFHADIVFRLSPLPRLPLLICYWKPEEGLESDLQLFFDSTAIENCGINTVFGLGQGIARMFEKVYITHG